MKADDSPVDCISAVVAVALVPVFLRRKLGREEVKKTLLPEANSALEEQENYLLQERDHTRSTEAPNSSSSCSSNRSRNRGNLS
jgi:hypothetical protein